MSDSKIGHSHAERHTKLRYGLEDLHDIAEGSFKSSFGRQLQKLDDWTARIAAIGQVKAGKSSMLNALIGDIGFLPSDVNPWTSVVTNMRVNIPGDPHCGACFEFFDESSWNRIINGDPRVRKAAEKHLPGFDPEILREQTEEMRRFAKRRLGDSFTKMLGSRHEYDLLSAELLESYVCAGPGIAEADAETAVGRYSAITKVANLYLQSDEYAVPTIITDTPGVNDPFLVRDEFTCQSLDQSDIFLIMLSAHQALTPVDVALIRMLALQGKKDIIIFVNRVDELEGPSDRAASVIADVRERLQEVVPGRYFPILFGSAYWAELALREDTELDKLREIIKTNRIDEFVSRHRADLDKPTLRLSTGIKEDTELTDEERAASQAQLDLRTSLLLASGLPELKTAISDAVQSGSGRRMLEAVSGETHAQIAAMRSVLNRQSHETRDRIELFGSGKTAEFRDNLASEMHEIARSHAQLSELVEASNADLDTAINDCWVSLQKSMDKEIRGFVEEQRELISELWFSENGEQTEAEVDLLELRSALEDKFHSNYKSARELIDIMLKRALADGEILSTSALGSEVGLTISGLPNEFAAATFSTTRKTLSFNLQSRRSWKFWKAKEVDIEKSLDGLRRVVAAEVFPATNRMVVAFNRSLAERALAGKGRLDLLVDIVGTTLTDRLLRLRADQRIISETDPEAARAKLVNRLQSDLEIIDNKLKRIGSTDEIFVDREAQAA